MLLESLVMLESEPMHSKNVSLLGLSLSSFLERLLPFMDLLSPSSWPRDINYLNLNFESFYYILFPFLTLSPSIKSSSNLIYSFTVIH